ncbi:MAG: LysM peptidoglycan-binding domain-containing protein [Chloroflexi bacterium]|nr:LysM peptidoglycan-binding domain-containing protein [Chloroflexota bacterium]
MKLPALPANLRDQLSQNRPMVLAVVFIAVLVLSFLIFLTTSILPGVRARGEAATDLADARQNLAKAQSQQAVSPADLQQQLVDAQTALTQSLGVFLPDYQASRIVDGLYQKASGLGVAIVDFQTEVLPAQGPKPLFTSTTARLRVQGQPYDLVRYLASLGETTVKGVALNTVTITRSEVFANLLIDLTLYTSPYAPEQAVPPGTTVDSPLPSTTPTAGQPIEVPTAASPGNPVPTADVLTQLVTALDGLWAAQDWGAAIPVIQQILTINPAYPDMPTKLYAAHVNFGYQLQNRGDIEGARREFTLALQANPNGGEATVALRNLLQAPTPVARGIYVVQPGDTLASIAQMFGATQQAIIQLNSLTNLSVIPGQQLLIP